MLGDIDYVIEHDLFLVANQIALEALEELDEVFEDDQRNVGMLKDRNHLDIIGNLVQPNRVYWLDN